MCCYALTHFWSPWEAGCWARWTFALIWYIHLFTSAIPYSFCSPLGRLRRALVIPVLCSAKPTFASFVGDSTAGVLHPLKGCLWSLLNGLAEEWSCLRVRGGVGCFLDELQIMSCMGIMEEIFLWLQVRPSLSSEWKLLRSLWTHAPLVCPGDNRFGRDALTPSLGQTGTGVLGLSLARYT